MTTTKIDPCAPVKRRKVNKAHTIKAWKKIKAKHKAIPICRHPGKLEDLLTIPAIDIPQLVTLDDTLPIVTALTDTDDGGPGVTTIVTDDTPPAIWQEQSYETLVVQTSNGADQPVGGHVVPEPSAVGLLALAVVVALATRRRGR